MSSKHEGAPWYRSQLGIDSQLPTTLFKVTNSSSTVTAVEEPAETTVPVPDSFVSDVPETDTLEFVPDIEEELPDDPVAGPEPPSTRQGINIDSLTVADLKELTRFPPSDLRQYHYFGGGPWLGRHRRDDSKTGFFAAELASENKGAGLPPLKKEKTDSVLKRGNTRCTSSSRDMVGRSGRQKTQRMTQMGVHRRHDSTVHRRYSPSTGLYMIIL